MTDATPTRDGMLVSVVMPARNSGATLERALQSVAAQRTDGPMEALVAVAPSTDDTEAVLRRMDSAFPLIVVPNPAGSTPAGLNAAIRAARGEVIVRCDAHSELPAAYVRDAIAVMEETGADVVGGIQDAVGEAPFERAVAYAMRSRLGSGGAAYRSDGAPGPVDTVYLGVFRRDTLSRVGLFDESMLRNQDYELNYRIRQAGGAVWFSPALRVRYRPRGRPGALWRQYYDYGRWKRCMIRRHPASMRLRQAAAPGLVVALALSAMAGPAAPAAAAVVPAVYLVSVASTALAWTIRHRDWAALGMAAALPIMHMAWGVGFLVGRVRDDGPRIPPLD